MTPLFTAALIVCAVIVFGFILRKIRKSEIEISDSTFWFLFAGSLVLLAIFPQIAYFCAGALGMEAPSNFVFLYVIAILVIRMFLMTVEQSKLRARLTELTQRFAMEDFEKDRDRAASDGRGVDR